jgi:hypothetical protein
MSPLMRFLNRACGRSCHPSCILLAGRNTSSSSRVGLESLFRAIALSCADFCRPVRRPATVAHLFLVVHSTEWRCGQASEVELGGGKGSRGR